jgi:hypothetical protein
MSDIIGSIGRSREWERFLRGLVTRAFLAVVALAVLLLPFLAFAQEASAEPVIDEQGLKLAQQLFDAIARGDWWMVAGVGVAVIVWALRRPLRRFMPAGVMRVLDMPVVAFSVPIVVALAGGFSAAALAGPLTGPVVGAVVLGALKTSMASAFSFLFGANLQEQVAAKPAGPTPQEQGATAGATVTSLSSARDTLTGKGPPAP